MRSVSKNNSRLITWLTVVVTLLPFVQYFASGLTAVAASTEAAEENLFDGDTGSGKISYQKDPDNKQIDWKITYQKKASELARQIGFSLKQNGETIVPTDVASQPADLFQVSGSTNSIPANTILQTQATKDAQQAQVTFKTPLVEKLSVQTVMNEWKTDGSQQDLLQTASPVTIAVKTEAPAKTSATTETSSSQSATKSSVSASSTETKATSQTSSASSTIVKNTAPVVKANLLQATGRDITTLPGADQLKDSNEGKTIFDSANMYVNGSTTPMKNGDKLNLNDSLLLKYNWSLPEAVRKNIKAGDFYKFKLPDSFKVQGDKEITGDLKNDQGTTFGQFDIQPDGHVTFTFTDAVAGNSGITGTFNLAGSINQVEINKPGGNTFTIPFTDYDKTVTPNIVVPNSKTLDKVVASQTSNAELKNNQGKVSWKLTVNKTGATMTAGVLNDTLPTGATLDKSTIKVMAYDVDLATGNLTGDGSDVTANVNADQSGQNVKFTFPDSDKAYVVTYDTADDLNQNLAADGKSAAVENEAVLSTQGAEDVVAKATATFGSASDIKKTAGTYDATKKVAAWTVNFTKAGLDIPKDAFFTDTMDNGQSFTDADGNALSLTELQQQLNDQLTKTGNAGKNVVVTKNDDGSYKMSFPQGISDSFAFTYYTKVAGKNGVTYNNGIKWNDKGNTANQEFIKQSGVTKGFVDQDKNGLPDTPGQATWQVGVNAENAPLDQWKVVDTMSNTTLQNASDVKVYEVKKGAADTSRTEVPASDYTVEPSNDDSSFTVTYNHASDSKFIIEYTSKYADDIAKNTQVTNHAAYTYWENGNDWTKEGNSSFVPNPDTQKQLAGNKGGSYNFTNNTVTWTINANTGKILFGENGILTDPIPADQTYDPAKANVKILNADGTAATGFTTTYVAKAETQTIAGYKIDGGTNGVLVVTGFPKAEADQYQVQFTTKMADASKLPTGTRTNTATLADDANKPVNIKGQVSYAKANGFISKGSNRDGNQIHYTVTVNPNNYPIHNVVVTDNNWQNVKVDPNSIVVKDQTGAVVDPANYKIESEEQQFKLSLGSIDSKYTVEYTGAILYNGDPNSSIKVSNDVQINGDNIQTDGQHTEKQDVVVVPSAGGNVQGETRNLTITKKDQKGNALKDAEFTLYRGKPKNGKIVISNVPTDAKGQIKFSNLTFDTYYLVETKAPTGYYTSDSLKAGVPYVINQTTDKEKGYLDPTTKATPVLVNQPTGQITLTKTDQTDSSKKLANATFELDQDGQKVTQDASGNPLDTFTTDQKGQVTIKNLVPGTYQLKEVTAPAGYQLSKTTTDATVVSDKTTAVTVKNTADTTTVSGQKTWQDDNDRDGVRPDAVTVQLMKQLDGQTEPVAVSGKTVKATKDNDWHYQFTNLPTTENGQKITYSVQEVNVTKDYAAQVDGTDITNIHPADKMNVIVKKVWDDHDNQDGKRPASVTVQLYANGQKVGDPVSLKADNQWTQTWKNLARSEAGKAIDYTVKENPVSDYTATVAKINDHTYAITNTHQPETTQVSGKKTWVDNHDQDGVRPEKITIHLLADGKKIQDQVVQADAQGNWTYHFDNLPKLKAGKAIDYTVSEDAVAGYKTEVAGDNLKNTHQPATTQVSVKKVWQDHNNQDGKRPTTVSVQLFADGAALGDPVTLDASNAWSYNWKDLAKFENKTQKAAQLVNYTVKEVSQAAGYTAKVVTDSSNKTVGMNYVIENSYTPQTTTVKGTKTWNDHHNQDGVRPASIKVQLYADGQAVAGQMQTVKATAADQWHYEFSNLPLYKAGKKIIYTVKEASAVKGYTEQDHDLDITNTHTPTVTKMAGTKTWDDNHDQDGLRPAKITVHLLADGQVVKSQTVTAADAWHYDFGELPKFKAGKAIQYTVSEDTVTGYTAKYAGLNIKNTHQLAVVTINGTKVWQDHDDQNKLRPASIKVQLYKNGQATDQVTTVKASSGNEWHYTFTDLPKFEKGKAITYSAKEAGQVAGYTEKDQGLVITNTLATTKYAGTKIWEDQNNQDNLRPAEITVELLQNGEKFSEQKISAATKWTYAFENLPKFDANDNLYAYSVKEENVPAGYDTLTVGKNIVNVHVPNLPHTPNVPSKPNLPNVPTIPGVPTIPTVPMIPNLPGLPEDGSKTPNDATPSVSIPEISLPTLSGTTNAPGTVPSAGATNATPAADNETPATSNQRFPKTNDKRNATLVVFGLILVAAVLYFWRKNRKHA